MWAVIGVLALVTVILVLAVCLRSCGSPQTPDGGSNTEQTQPDMGQATPDSPDQPDSPAPDETQPTPPVDPTADPGGDTTQPGEDDPPPETDGTGQTEPTKDNEPVIPSVTVPPQELLECEQYAVFSGAFVEDGSDEPVQNVAAILVTNGSDQYLDLGKLTYQLDGEEATFMVTGLPPGASAWVMEASRRTATNDSVFTQTDCTTSFRENAVNELEGLSIQSGGTMLKVTNNRDKALQNVTLYYKVLHNDGNYFGGITYMVAFGDLEPGQSAEKLAGHFKEGWTDIVRIGYQEAS